MIKYESTFNRKLPAGFDGKFDWDWTRGCFGDGLITPMDTDGMVERKGNFLLFETKDIGVPIPNGQLITLNALYSLSCFTVMFIYGKSVPELVSVWDAPDFRDGKVMDANKPITVTVNQAAKYCSAWYEYACSSAKRGIGRWDYYMTAHVNDDDLLLPGQSAQQQKQGQ